MTSVLLRTNNVLPIFKNQIHHLLTQNNLSIIRKRNLKKVTTRICTWFLTAPLKILKNKVPNNKLLVFKKFIIMNENTKSNRGVIAGMFPNRESAEKAYHSLEERGYTKDDINLIMSEDTRKKYFSVDSDETVIGSKAAEG